MFELVRDYFKRLATRRLLKKKSFKELEKLLGHKINNTNLFIEALTHRSILDGSKFKVSNERLEYLGDAVLGMVIAEHLFKSFPGFNEGNLTKMRSNLVNRNTLYDIAIKINLSQHLFIQKELLHPENAGLKTILADAFESLVGAIYLEFGFNACKQFIGKHILSPTLEKGLHLVDENYKSQLLELIQKHKLEQPRYLVVNEEGPEHDRTFTICVSIGTQIFGEGRGRNKKSAEQLAAKSTLEKLSILMNSGEYPLR